MSRLSVMSVEQRISFHQFFDRESLFLFIVPPYFGPAHNKHIWPKFQKFGFCSPHLVHNSQVIKSCLLLLGKVTVVRFNKSEWLSYDRQDENCKLKTAGSHCLHSKRVIHCDWKLRPREINHSISIIWKSEEDSRDRAEYLTGLAT